MEEEAVRTGQVSDPGAGSPDTASAPSGSRRTTAPLSRKRTSKRSVCGDRTRTNWPELSAMISGR